MRATLVLAGLAVIFTCAIAASVSAQRVTTDQQPADTLVVLRRGACEHRCPVYNVVIFSDGSVVFDGRAYVRRPGLTKGTISMDSLRQLLTAADELRFFDLPSIVSGSAGDACSSLRSDGPQVVVAISRDSKSKTIRHDHRCVSETSDRLTKFEDSIDQAAGTARFR